MKVIILGAGGRGNVYAKYFSENGVEIAGLADPNTERLHKVANSNGIPEASLYHSWEEVLEKPKFADAVVNATTDHLHYKSTMKAIERGYHILIEKPISPSENECIEMVEAAERKNLIFAVCHVLRYAPFFEKIKESGLKEDLLQQSFFLLQMNNLIAYLTKLFENGKDFQLDTKVLNRNFLLHGMSKKNVSQKECKQLFLAVYNTKLIIEGVNGRLKKKNVNITQMLSN